MCPNISNWRALYKLLIIWNRIYRSVMNFVPVNPRNIDKQNKSVTKNKNIYLSGYGAYQMCPWQKSLRAKYRKDFNRGQTNSVCKVFIKHMHALDVVGGLSVRGLTELKSNNPYPVIINPMFREFNGNNDKTNEVTPDENVILRTNFSFIVKKQENLFPVSSDSEIVYTSPVTVIRDMGYNEIQHENLYRTGIITVTPQRSELIERIVRDGDQYEKLHILDSKHLLKLQTQLETAFQVAAMCGHNSVVVSLFDEEFGIPVDDQIILYNYCIVKYGHFFNAIIFGIPPYQSADLVSYLEKNITKPQRIASDVEMNYQTDAMNDNFEKNVSGDNKSKPNSKTNTDINNMTESEKMSYMRKIVKKKKEEVRAKIVKKKRKKH
jgi:hypothetical protein